MRHVRTPERDGVHQVTVAASFTAEPVEPVIDFWAGRLELPVTVDFAGYGQVFQELLDGGSAMAGATRGLNVALVRWTDLLRGGDSPADAADGVAELRRTAAELADAARDAARRWAVPLLVVVCPDTPGAPGTVGLPPEATAAAEEELVRSLRSCAGVHVLSPADLESWYPGAVTADPYADRLGHVPYTTTGFVALGTAIVRHLYRVLTPEPKVIVVDADNTLWDGVAGEGELTELVIGPARRALQELLAGQRGAGRLLCLCSKNAPADTMAVLDGHPDMRLGTDDFAAVRINWRSKADNLRELAEELNLGLDSFVFVDDNPVECAEVRARCPQVAVLQLPPDAREAELFLRHSWILDVGGTTDEDARRAAHYRTEAERDRVRRSAPTLRGFLDSLGLRVDLAPAGPDDVARVAQLTQRTNQFNLTGVRRSEQQVRDLMGSKECLIVTAEDRFGSYGQVGVVIGELAGSALRLETFLLSCRALGRGVEHRMLAHVGALAEDRGLESVELVYRGTPRNRPAADFVRDVLALGPTATLGDGVFPLPAAVAATAVHHPAEHAAAGSAPPSHGPGGSENVSAAAEDAPAGAGTGAALWALADRMSPLLATAERIEERMRAASAPVPTAAGEPDDPASTQEAVAALMAGVLGLQSVGQERNFFELGGTSIQLIGFMAAIRDRFGIELPTDTMYNSELTVRGISASILLHTMTDPGAVGDVLALVESMTDEQIEAMLGSLDEEEDSGVQDRSDRGPRLT